jgi:D-glycero-beta-D-manno-heptose-7-phosphate kinase
MKNILQNFENQEVLIVGDVMIDRYLTGTVSRISPEAPVPVVLHRATEDRLGGAANVALNVRALGGTPWLCSVVGHDSDGSDFSTKILAGAGIASDGIVRSAARKTTVKTRVLANNQQMLRIDQEDAHELSAQESENLLGTLLHLLDTRPIRVVILQDYNKGVLTAALIEAVVQAARQRGIPIAVDPKKANFFAYRGVDLFKPNLKEIRDSVPFEVRAEAASLQVASDFLREKLQNSVTMVTLSEKGLFLDGGAGGQIFPTVARNVADVSGAGDTVISIAAMGLAAGLDWADIATLSNLAGGQVCEFPGVVPVRLDILAREWGER